jgi:transcriptional regulator with XRE-family HTH domain
MSRGVRDPALRAECLRLRREERLSLNEIHARTGAAKGSLSAWLRSEPLTSDEVRAKCAHSLRTHPRVSKKPRGDASALYRLVGGRTLSPVEVGRAAEFAAALRMVLHGMIPFKAPFDGAHIDWLVQVPGVKHPLKVQVKCAHRSRAGLPFVSVRRTSGHTARRRYNDDEVDILVGYDLRTDTCYVWRWSEIGTRSSAITVSPEAAECWEKLLDPVV